MPKEKVGLPHGRGFLKGEDAKILQQEEWARRVREKPASDGWFLAPDTLFDAANGNSSTTGKVFLIPLPRLLRDITLSSARTWVAGAGTSAVLKAAIYLYSVEKKTFHLIPGTKVSKTLSGTGLLELPLDKEPILQANQRYFLGTYTTSSVAPTVREISAGTLLKIGSKTVSDLPNIVSRGQLDFDTDLVVPYFAYVSKEATEFL